MGLSNTAISWKLLIFSIWHGEQKMFLFYHTYNRYPWWNGPGRHGPIRPCYYLTSYFCASLKDPNLKLQHNLVIGFKKFISNFEWNFYICFVLLEFLVVTVFLPFFHTWIRITQEPLIISKFVCFTQRTSQHPSETLQLWFELTTFMRYIIFFGQIDRTSPQLPEILARVDKYGWTKAFELVNKHSNMIKTFLFPGS